MAFGPASKRTSPSTAFSSARASFRTCTTCRPRGGPGAAGTVFAGTCRVSATCVFAMYVAPIVVRSPGPPGGRR
ncbi:hypothetical protein GCM10009736_02590 [Actinomadura bangladeshensis]